MDLNSKAKKRSWHPECSDQSFQGLAPSQISSVSLICLSAEALTIDWLIVPVLHSMIWIRSVCNMTVWQHPKHHLVKRTFNTVQCGLLALTSSTPWLTIVTGLPCTKVMESHQKPTHGIHGMKVKCASQLLMRISASTKVSRKVSIWGRIWALRWSSSSDGTTCRSNHKVKRNKPLTKTDGGKCRKEYFQILPVEVIDMPQTPGAWRICLQWAWFCFPSLHHPFGTAPARLFLLSAHPYPWFLNGRSSYWCQSTQGVGSWVFSRKQQWQGQRYW